MGDGWIVAGGGLIATGSAAIAAAVVAVLNARAKNKQEADASAHKLKQEADETALAQCFRVIGELKLLLGRQDEQLARAAADIAELRDEGAECDVRVAELYGTIGLMRNVIMRLVGIAREAGEDPGEIPEVPPRPPHRTRERPEYMARSAAHNADLLKRAGEVIQPPRPPGGAGGPPP